MDKTVNLPGAEALAKLYKEAVKSNHMGKADMLKAALLKTAASEGAAVEANLLRSFAQELG